MIELYSKVFGLDLEVELDQQPEYYINTFKDTIGDYDVPNGTCTYDVTQVGVPYDDILKVYMAIESTHGNLKVDLMPVLTLQSSKFKLEFCEEIELAIFQEINT